MRLRRIKKNGHPARVTPPFARWWFGVWLLPDHSTIDYAYDAAHLTSVERNGYRYQYVYDLSGRVKETLSSSIGETHYRYDPRGAPLSLVSENLSQECVYDSVGNLTSLKHVDPLGEVNASYIYDHLNQLASESGFADHVYLTDSFSNRRLKHESSYQMNDLNQLVNLEGRHFSYDQNGNLEDFEAPVHCVYDALDRLTEVHTQNHVYRYAYDSFHRRLSRMVYDQNDRLHEQRYLYSGECEIGYIEQGEIRQLRVLGNSNVDIGSAVLVEIDGSKYVPQHDLRGNVSHLIDSSGNAEVYRYSAFGEELFASATSPWRFSSKRVDEETGWVYFGRRYFAPDWGRWTTADPTWFADGPNLYAYVHNNPLR